MKHIEFLGIPGAGKSTFVRPTVEYLQQDRRPACTLETAFREVIRQEIATPIPEYLLQYFPTSYVKKYRMIVYRIKGRDSEHYQLFFTQYPELGSIIPKYIAKKTDRVSDRRVYSNWFYNLIIRYYASEKLSGRRIVIDEGFVNRTITLFCGHEHPAENVPDLERYLGSIPTPDLVIIPQVPIEVSASRIRDGDRSFPYNVSETDHQEQLEYLKERQAHVDTVLGILDKQGVNTILVDNSGDKTEAKEELRTKLESPNLKEGHE